VAGGRAISWRWRLYLITFVESVASIALERGLYFFTTERLAFGGAANLGVALAFGLAYVVGALLSHPVAERLGERRLLRWTLVVLAGLHAGLAAWPTAAGVWVAFPLIGLVTGLKWPVIESYVGAGLDERQTRRALGRFNLSWSVAVPITIGGAGLAAAVLPAWAFFAAVIPLHAATWWLTWRIPVAPEHAATPGDADAPGDRGTALAVADDGDARAAWDAAGLAWRGRLLWASRWLLAGACALMFLIAPLIPGMLRDLGVGASAAGGWAAVLDAARVAAFVGMMAWGGWHGRAWPIVLSMLALPAGAGMVLFGGSLAMVVAGEVVFGLATGVVYFAALYYAMVVKRASVDAGGVHEALIGGGFAIGPAIGLVGLTLAGAMGGEVAGMLAGLGPWVVLIGGLAALALLGVGPGQRRALARG
jgi:hypothetical protein